MENAIRVAGELVVGDMRVRRLGFGAMRLIGPNAWGDAPDVAEAHDVLRRAVSLGVNFIDTARSYGPETDERLIADALAPYPDDLLVATKSGFARGPAGEWRPDGRPTSLRADCERSLQNLRLEALPLLQLHTVDPDVPIEESLGALGELQQEGKVRHIGVSNVSPEELARARAVVDVVSVQNRLSVVEQGEDAVLEACEADGVAFLPWFPLGGGVVEHAGAVEAVARRRSVSTHQVAVAWLLRRSPMMLAIPGTSSVAHLEENVAAAALELEPEDLALLAGGG